LIYTVFLFLVLFVTLCLLLELPKKPDQNVNFPHGDYEKYYRVVRTSVTHQPSRYMVTVGIGKYNARRIVEEAIALQYFDAIVWFNDTLPEWKDRAPNHQNEPLGAGLWYWKPLSIQHVMKTLTKPGDILFYVDAGCTLQESEQWDSFFKDIVTRDLLAFRLRGRDLKEQQFTKRLIFDRLGSSPENHIYGETNQIGATWSFWRNTKESGTFLRSWIDLVLDFNVVNNEISDTEHPSFIANRNDQSIYSLLVKQAVEKEILTVMIVEDPSDKIRVERQAIWASRKVD